MKINHFVSIHKLATFLAVMGMIGYFHQWENPTAWTYLGMHSTYGLLWVLKAIYFPDRNWEAKTTLWFGIFVAWGSLTTYWVAPWLICYNGVRVPLWLVSMSIFTFCLGIFFHFTADMQKTIALRYKPGHLITDGIWSLSRNPNYFGELLIYLGLSILAMHWLPIAILCLWVTVYWLPNMRKKDRSLARYPEFPGYKAKTKLFIPYIF